MRKIYLSGKDGAGRFALVDDENFEFLSQWRWLLHPSGYATRSQSGKYLVYMHRIVIEAAKGTIVDHNNRNRLDNQSANLRLATAEQNGQNQRVQRRAMPKSSVYKGVTLHNRSGLWRARIVVDGKEKSLGYYKTEQQAAMAYDVAARLAFGSFAAVNGVAA